MNRQFAFNLAAAVAAAFATTAAAAATITVNSTADAALDDGQCTLREAITSTSTNLASGVSSGECAAGEPLPAVDTIAFAIAGTGVHTIQPTSTLPSINEAVIIDGYTQSGAHPNTLAVGDDAALMVEIDGSLLGSGDLLHLPSAGSILRGLAINRVNGYSVFIGSSNPGDGNLIAGNFFNTDPTGTVLEGGHFTVLRVSGTNNIVGGTAPADRNVFGGGGGSNAGTLAITGSSNVVQGNYIGLDASGTVPLLPDGGVNGIELSVATDTLIGGDEAGAGNVIVASQVAIRLSSGLARTTIQGNLIGTDASSEIPLTPGAMGIRTDNGPADTLVGGLTSGAGNVFSGLGTGIYLIDGPTGFVIQGNRFGTDRSGTQSVPNRGSAIFLEMPGINGSIIGGTDPGAANTIAYNCGYGVQFAFGPNHWPILGNSIHSNGGLGISFNGPSPSVNDAGDGDTGANDLQNYPVITSAVAAGGSVTVSGTLNSTPSTAFRLEFFASEFCDATGFGEGQQFIGTTDVTTDANGDASFGPLSFAAPDDAEITATATDPAGNTSEFSQCAGPHDHLFASGFDVGGCGA